MDGHQFGLRFVAHRPSTVIYIRPLKTYLIDHLRFLLFNPYISIIVDRCDRIKIGKELTE